MTTEQLRAGFARNATSLADMAATAERTGRKVHGFTAEYLTGKAAEYRALATADDETLRAHLARAARADAADLARMRGGPDDPCQYCGHPRAQHSRPEPGNPPPALRCAAGCVCGAFIEADGQTDWQLAAKGGR